MSLTAAAFSGPIVIHSDGSVTDAVILTGENLSFQRKTCTCAILSTTNLMWTSMLLNPRLLYEMPATTCLSYGASIYENFVCLFRRKKNCYSLERVCPSRLRSGRPKTRWADTFKRVAGGQWLRAAKNRSEWNRYT
jgi:hypothetical protein